MRGEVIERVHALSQRNLAGGEIIFGWRNGHDIDDMMEDPDDFHDEDYIPGQDNSDNDPDGDTDDDHSQASVPPPVAGVDDENSENESDNEDNDD
jgi:hypothetical protein